MLRKAKEILQTRSQKKIVRGNGSEGNMQKCSIQNAEVQAQRRASQTNSITPSS